MEGDDNDEILALEAIYENDLTIEDLEDGKRIGITIHPATAEDSASQYVSLELSFILTQKYPSDPPKINFSKSRGLSDVSLDEIRRKMLGFLEERTGECVLFDLLEIAKDTLTFNNIPSCLCSICLSGFEDGDDFIKTECFHYFHCYCLNDYKRHLDSDQETTKLSKHKNSDRNLSKVTVPCPVCRLPVTLDIGAVQEAKPPLDTHEIKVDKEALKTHKKKFEKLYKKQLENGGLIDLEYEQNKYLLSNIQQAYETQKASLSAPDEFKESEDATAGAKKASKSDAKSSDSKKNNPSSSVGTKQRLYYGDKRHRTGNNWRDNQPQHNSRNSPNFHNGKKWRNRDPKKDISKSADETGTHNTNHRVPFDKDVSDRPLSNGNYGTNTNGKLDSSSSKVAKSPQENGACNTSEHRPRSGGRGKQYYGPRIFNRAPCSNGNFRPKSNTKTYNNNSKSVPLSTNTTDLPPRKPNPKSRYHTGGAETGSKKPTRPPISANPGPTLSNGDVKQT